ncbi:MAG: SDR family NAD(P)-dependent oxidoreductase [Pseudohongiellaceae bacterium]
MDSDLLTDLTGKVFVVTGANSGIGFEACRNFAKRGATLAMVCRDKTRGTIALEQLKQETKNQQLQLFIADFCSMENVVSVARSLLSAYPSIDVLCNNAGSANSDRVLTDDGFETTLAANHLSGFLLTQKLLPALLSDSGGSARVIFTSSLGHKNSPLDFDDLNLSNGYGTLKAYGRSKLMNLLTARTLDQRYRHKGIIASSFHPGAVRTEIWGKGGLLAKLLGIVMYPFMWNVEKGADTLIWLASSEEEGVLKAEGKYFFDRQNPTIAEFATDDAADQLWSKSEELIANWLSVD